MYGARVKIVHLGKHLCEPLTIVSPKTSFSDIHDMIQRNLVHTPISFNNPVKRII